MSSDDTNSGGRRRSSFTSATFNSLLGRSNTTGSGINPFPGPITTAAAQDQRRRMSLNGTSPTSASPFARRVSVSTTNSDTIPENAIVDDDDGPSNPASPMQRRMSKAAEDVLNGSNALRRNLGNTNPGGEGFNWSEQIRSRAESSVSSATGGRPSFSNPSPSAPAPPAAIHEKMEAPKPPPPQTFKDRLTQKPDEIGERMLKGDYYY